MLPAELGRAAPLVLPWVVPESEAVDVLLLALLPAAAHHVQLVVQDGRRAVAALDVRHSCKLPPAAPTVVSVVVRHLVGEPGRPEAPDPDHRHLISIPRLYTILKVALCRSGESLSSAASRSRTCCRPGRSSSPASSRFGISCSPLHHLVRPLRPLPRPRLHPAGSRAQHIGLGQVHREVGLEETSELVRGEGSEFRRAAVLLQVLTDEPEHALLEAVEGEGVGQAEDVHTVVQVQRAGQVARTQTQRRTDLEKDTNNDNCFLVHCSVLKIHYQAAVSLTGRLPPGCCCR